MKIIGALAIGALAPATIALLPSIECASQMPLAIG